MSKAKAFVIIVALAAIPAVMLFTLPLVVPSHGTYFAGVKIPAAK